MKNFIFLLLLALPVFADTPPPNTVKAKMYSGDGLTSLTATGTALDVNVTNGSGTSTVNQGNAGSQSWLVDVTNTVPISGALTCNAGTGTFLVDGSAHTQPVSGTLTCNAGSGTLLVDGSAHTQPISAAALPLPAGAATSLLQLATNTTLGSPFQAGGSIGNTSFGSTQSGVWTTGRTWNLSSGSDSVAVTQSTSPWATSDVAGGSVSGGTAGTKSLLGGGVFNTSPPSLTNGQQAALQLDSSGNLKTTATLSGGTIGVTQSTSPWVVSGSVTANAGTNLNTSLLALESGGNLASINTKTPALGQALAAASVPVVLTASQLSTLTPPSTVTVTQATGANLHTVVDSGSITATQATGSNLHTVVDSGSVSVSNFPATQPVSGTVTANAGTNLNTSLLALESGGNLASINTKTPALGQALAAASVPVVLTASQLSTITPLSSVTVTQGTGTNLHTVVDSGSVTVSGTVAVTGVATAGNQTSQITQETTTATNTGTIVSNQTNGTQKTQVTAIPSDSLPSPINVTVQDSASSTTAGANGQNFITGTPTTNSAASFALSTFDAIEVQVTGTWTGTVATEVSMDGGTTWFTRGIKQTGSSYLGSSYTANFEGGMNFAGMTNIRVRATAAMTGTAVVRVTASVNPASLVVSNPLTLRDATTQSVTSAIKPASTAALTTDNALVVAVSPNNSVAVTNSDITSINTKIPALGQTTKSASQPVTMASDQPPLPYISTSGTITTQNLNPNNGVATAGSTVELALSSTGSATIQTVGTYSGALSIQATLDGVQWIGAALTIFNIATGANASTIPSAQNSIYVVPAIGYTKIRVTALGAVTGSVVVTINASPADSIFKFISNSSLSTTNQITNGQTANSSASSGTPVRAGGRIITTPDTTYVQGDAADVAITTGQQLLTKPFATSELDWQATSGLTPLATTTSTQLKAAGAASIRNFVTSIQLYNTSATVSTTVTILDGATVLWTGFLPATTAALPVVPVTATFLTPLRGSTATAMNIQLGTTLASVYYNVQGYQSF